MKLESLKALKDTCEGIECTIQVDLNNALKRIFSKSISGEKYCMVTFAEGGVQKDKNILPFIL